jgi:capsular exopolysaccharide synthesis family protein
VNAPGQFQAADGEIVGGASRSQMEAIDAIAGRLIRMRPDGRPLAVAVCSVEQGDGASFVAAHVALAIAGSGYSTLLIDADLDHPTVPRLIAPAEGVPGLADLLRSDAVSIGDVVQPGPVAALSVIHAHGEGERPTELLATARFAALIDDCIRTYEFTIVDTPPANRSANALSVIDAVGAALIVARLDHTFMDDVATLARSCVETGAKVIGATLIEG